MVLPANSNCVAMLIYLSEVKGVLETHAVLWPVPMGTTPKMQGQASSKLRFDKALLRYSQFQVLEIFLVQTQCAWASHHPQPFWSPYVEEKALILTKLSVNHFLEKGLIWSHFVLPYRVTRDFREGSQKGTLKVLSRCSPSLYNRTSSLGLPLSHLVLRFLGFLSVSFHALSTLYKVPPLLSLHSSHFVLPNLVSSSLTQCSLPLMQGLPHFQSLHVSLVWCSDSTIRCSLRVRTFREG